VTAPDGPFEQSKGDGQPAGTVGDTEMLEVAEKVSTEAECDAGDNGRKVIAADLAGVEIHPNAGSDNGEKDCEIERDVGREQAEEKKVEGIADPGLGPGQQGKTAVDLAHPERQLARPEGFAEREAIGEILVHEIAGEDVVGDEQALHRRQLPERGENDNRDECDGGPGLVLPTLVGVVRDGAGFHLGRKPYHEAAGIRFRAGCGSPACESSRVGPRRGSWNGPGVRIRHGQSRGPAPPA